jgi:hypothetical protein
MTLVVCLAALALSAWHNVSCGQANSWRSRNGCDTFNVVIAILWVLVIIVIAELVTFSWGLCQISKIARPTRARGRLTAC